MPLGDTKSPRKTIGVAQIDTFFGFCRHMAKLHRSKSH